MANLEELKAQLQAQMDAAKKHREKVLKDMGLEEKDLVAKPTCSLCGGYVHVAAEFLCKKHAADLENQYYCNYCLSNVTGFTVEELKQQYLEEK